MDEQNTSGDNSNANKRAEDNTSKTMPRNADAETETTRTMEK